MLVDYIKTFIFSFGSMFFFSFVTCAPKRTRHVAGLIGAVGYIVFFAFKKLGIQDFLCYFLATLIMAILCELCAIWQKTPATTFISISILGLVPGIDLYRTMQLLTLGEYSAGTALGISAILAIGTMAMALALCVFVVRMVRKQGSGFR